ncbi:RtcB family protein [Anaeromicrobium sediminis]|uniref:3'-phosphate/5'-hydroxy nucleic acid ligase n=1 Tax=Anaeromicrobium sediminis TaxID=1478221 RepID=A0A267MEJ1_9FIRM|nr:RtcB family protein [Anaeromicrobium sediminis]PAB57877.1 hypothetical protein CCE28_17935 [Anaeromicrobium sediminis]
MKLKGKYTNAKIFADRIDDKAFSQIENLLNHKAFENVKVRIMPDVHAGMGCVIGFTANLGDKVIPNLVGVDIGCGMEVTKLGRINIDFEKLDNMIRKEIPSGFSIHKKAPMRYDKDWSDRLRSISNKTKSDFNRHICSIGTLGGGNHFIEINEGKDKEKYLVIHSGSRNLGNVIAKYHQNKAINYCEEMKNKNSVYDVTKDLAFLENEDRLEYIEDMNFAQEFAELNRKVISKKICEFLNIDYDSAEKFTTIHNYVNMKDFIIRKGAICANKDEVVIIPMNMRDGSIIGIGQGNEDWNNSAPHGAGRILSRKAAKDKLCINEYKKSMEGIWSSSVSKSTLDESPMAYKPMDEVKKHMKDTLHILDHIKPLYNFKAK